ncbi:MAG: gluconate 2-dehydrogenase subunit 3 family protein [Anaerolineae bacterium]|nr:gluconate 2-dehydrogenase subunit 3 family protein [Anaerolineae bacterium]
MLSTTQQETLQAVVNRIIPPDDWPGGWEAGVGDYLLRQFAGDLSDVLESYQQGLAALDIEAQAAYGSGFAPLDATRQDVLLERVEHGNVRTAWPLDPAMFFNLLVQHCAEGFYADPGSGGNRDEIAWKMIGFEVRG